MARRGDDLLFARKYAEAARQSENALLELNERHDAGGLELRRQTLEKLGEVRHLYLNDAQGALRAYHAAAELSPGTDSAFESRLRVVTILRDRVGDASAAATELGSLIDAYPSRDGVDRLRLEHAQLSFRAGRYQQALESAMRVMKSGKALEIEAASLVASIHEVEGRTQDALRTYQGMLEMRLPEEMASNIRFEVGHCHEALGDLRSAIEEYQAAQRGSPNPALIEARLARVQARLDASLHPKPKNAPAPIVASRHVAHLSPLHQD
jgi:tetratricopeptide (TPR) repeat protein